MPLTFEPVDPSGHIYEWRRPVPTFSYAVWHRTLERMLQNALGLELEDFEGYGGREPWSSVQDPLARLASGNETAALIRHSDCLDVAHAIRRAVEGWSGTYEYFHAIWAAQLLEQAHQVGADVRIG